MAAQTNKNERAQDLFWFWNETEISGSTQLSEMGLSFLAAEQACARAKVMVP